MSQQTCIQKCCAAEEPWQLIKGTQHQCEINDLMIDYCLQHKKEQSKKPVGNVCVISFFLIESSSYHTTLTVFFQSLLCLKSFFKLLKLRLMCKTTRQQKMSQDKLLQPQILTFPSFTCQKAREHQHIMSEL